MDGHGGPWNSMELAELVEADGLGMPQSVKIYSQKALDDHIGLLATIDVQDSQCHSRGACFGFKVGPLR